MAVITFAQVNAIASATIHMLEETYKYGGANSPNLVGLSETLLDTAQGDDPNAIAVINSIAAVIRRSVSAVIGPDIVRAIVTSLLELYMMCSEINEPVGSAESNALRLYNYMLGASQTLNSAEMTYGTPSAGAGMVGVGGAVYRLTVNEDGYGLEGGHMEAKRMDCVVDQGGTNKHAEQWTIRGKRAEPDDLVRTGSGGAWSVKCLTTRNTAAFLNNPNFTAYSGTTPTTGNPSTPGSTTQLTGWVIGTAANTRIDVDTVFRTDPGVSTPYSVKFTGNNTLTQTFESQLDPSFGVRTPYLNAIHVYRESSCDGTMTLTMGSKTQDFAMSGLNNAAWNKVVMDRDKDLYYKNWKTNSATIAYALASWSTGALYLHVPIFAPFTAVDGTLLSVIGGTTPYMRDDFYTWTDSTAARTVLQYWLCHRSGIGITFPSAAGGTETIADP